MILQTESIKEYVIRQSDKYNMSDLLIDLESEIEFIRQNKDDNLYKAVYRFYYNDPNSFITDDNGNEIKIEIIYDLAGANKENTKTGEGIKEIARNAMEQFKNQWYTSVNEGITRYGKYFSTTTSNINSDANTYKFEFNKLHYQVDYYKTSDTFVSGNHSQFCNLYVANELPSPRGNDKDFVLEIGSWNYRVQFPNVTSGNGYSSWNDNYNTFYHWDRTYELSYYYSHKGFKQLDTPNQACRWKSAPMYGSNSRESKAGYSAFVDRDTKWMWTAESMVFGKTTDPTNVADNGGCIPAGSTNGSPYYGMTERHEAARANILSPYSLFKDVSANDLQDTHAGFYSVSLYLLPDQTFSRDQVYNMCYKRDYVNGKVVYNHAIKVSDGSDIGESGYWCHASTMYALTNRYHQIPGLSGTNVTEIIMNNNGNVAAESHSTGLYTAVNEQVNACYGKNC